MQNVGAVGTYLVYSSAVILFQYVNVRTSTVGIVGVRTVGAIVGTVGTYIQQWIHQQVYVVRV